MPILEQEIKLLGGRSRRVFIGGFTQTSAWYGTFYSKRYKVLRICTSTTIFTKIWPLILGGGHKVPWNRRPQGVNLVKWSKNQFCGYRKTIIWQISNWPYRLFPVNLVNLKTLSTGHWSSVLSFRKTWIEKMGKYKRSADRRQKEISQLNATISDYVKKE